MKTADQMTKQEIIDKLTVLGLSIDKTAKVDVLRAQLMAVMNGEGANVFTPEAMAETMPAYLKHPVNGRVFVATAELVRRGDMLPATEAEFKNQ